MFSRRDFLTAGAAALAVGLGESILAPGEARADVPGLINYQGKLFQPSGAPIPDGTYAVTFSIYDAAIGGTALWTESYSALPVKGSMFHALLGSVNPINPSVFSGGERYLGVKVGTDAELAPRQRIASVPYAQVAETVAVGTVPVGAVISWWGDSSQIPDGWALCDGSAVNDSASPLNGVATPNLVNRFIRGATGNVRAGAPTGGADSQTLSVAQMPAHSHGVNDPGHSHFTGAHVMNNHNFSGTGFNPVSVDAGYPNLYTDTKTTGITLQNTGGGQPFSTVPSYVGLVYIVRVR